MNLKKNHYSRRALALLLTLVMCVGMIPHRFCRPAEQLPRPRRALDAGVRPYQ